MKKKISKFINIVKNEGLIKSLRRTFTYITGNFIRINFYQKIKYYKNKDNLSKQIDEILNQNDYDRIIIWRGTFGWNGSLFQRPQQIALCLKNKRCLVLYEVTHLTDKINFIKFESDNLYLINYELKDFSNLLFEKLKIIEKPKYLQLYSTSWDVSKEIVDNYVNNGFKLLYEYIDDLNPKLAGVDKLPQNVKDIYDYVIENKDVLVVTSANILYNDILKKRGNKENIILSSNGVDLNHFLNLNNIKILEMENIKKKYKTIIGYYGALASWFDYSLIKQLAKNNKDKVFVLIGIKYDTSFNEAGLTKYSNIIYLGKKDYEVLPEYAKYFDIAWIPFIINGITLATNPIKVFEYMALNKFIVTSDLPECHKYKSVNIAKKMSEYQYYFDNYKLLYTNEYKEILKIEAEKNSWNYKAEEIIKLFKENE